MAHKSGEIIKQLGRFFNHKVSFDKNYISAKFVLPGFQYSHIDRAGQVNLYNLNQVLESSRIVTMTKEYEKFFPRDPTGKTAMVMFAQQFTVARALYESAKMDLPMIFENRLIALGNTSMVREISLSEQSSGSHLATTVQKLVNMDLEARRSCALFPKMKETYEKMISMGTKQAFEDILPPKVPNNVFNTTRTVRHSEMDFMFHTNQSMYMKYFLDALCEGVNKEQFTKLTSDICLYKAHKAKTLHFAETRAGHLLGIHVWEDGANPYRMHCVISNFSGGISNASMVYYSSIDFFEDSV